jgi:putative ABC transport system permease protein
VDWVVPLSLGDSHRGFPVMGTTAQYFQRFLWGDRQPLALREGRAFSGNVDGVFEAVLGAEVARALGYRLGDRITLTHGSGPAVAGPLAVEHADHPFTVTGILQPTGTPVDRTVHVSLQAITALHLDWVAGVPMPGARATADDIRRADLEPRQVTAALVGLKSRAAVFAVQRFVADHREEPLMAVLPGVALDELWTVVGAGERALMAVSALVALVSVAGLVAVVLAGLGERRRELAVLRAVGAGPRHVVGLLALEGALVTAAGVVAGALLAVVAAWALGPLLQQRLGIALPLGLPTAAQWALTGAVMAAGMLASLLPAWRAYRLSLADGLSPRL